MQLPIKIIIIIAVAVMVLVALVAFFFQSSGSSFTRAEAERVFNTMCTTYSQRQCDWSVTYEQEFSTYLDACRTLYGPEREAFSCLYVLCQSCKETTDLRCSGLCNICNGHEFASVERTTCCSRFSAECGQFQCDSC